MNHIGIQIGWPTHSEPSGQRLPEQGQNQIGTSMPDRGAIWQSQIWQIAFFNLATQKAIWQSGNLEKQSGQILGKKENEKGVLLHTLQNTILHTVPNAKSK